MVQPFLFLAPPGSTSSVNVWGYKGLIPMES